MLHCPTRTSNPTRLWFCLSARPSVILPSLKIIFFCSLLFYSHNSVRSLKITFFFSLLFYSYSSVRSFKNVFFFILLFYRYSSVRCLQIIFFFGLLFYSYSSVRSLKNIFFLVCYTVLEYVCKYFCTSSFVSLSFKAL